MGIERVGDKHPFCIGIGCYRRPDVRHKVVFCRASPRVGQMTLPVATSKLVIRDCVPCRVYSNSCNPVSLWTSHGRDVSVPVPECLSFHQHLSAKRPTHEAPVLGDKVYTQLARIAESSLHSRPYESTKI